MCYGKQFENQGNDNEQSMHKKVLKDEIDAINEKIRALTEEKEKRECEYRYLCDLNHFGYLLKENSNKFQEFKILIGCRKSESDNEHWTNIIVDDCKVLNKITVPYPLSDDFNREFRELIYKYFKNSN